MARPPVGTSRVELSADVQQFIALAGKASALEPRIRRNLRKELKAEGEKAAVDVRDEVRKEPGTRAARPRRTGLRDGIARGVKTQLATGRTPGVNIRATGSGLPAGKRVLVKRWNRENGWRHPVFAGGAIGSAKETESLLKSMGARRGDVSMRIARATTARVRGNQEWVTQVGRPYFGKVIFQHREQVAAGVKRALEAAARTL